MKKILITFFTVFFGEVIFAQSINDIINLTKVERIESILSSDSMEGRKIYTAGIEKAAGFIASEFKKNGLQYFEGLSSYRQKFKMLKIKIISAQGNSDNQPIDPKNVLAFTAQQELRINNNSGFEKILLPTDSNFLTTAREYIESDKNYLIIVNPENVANFNRLKRLQREVFEKSTSVIFLLSSANPIQYNLAIKHEISEMELSNVIGVLPGKRRKNEYVIFSAHYDHLGIGYSDVRGDSIYNGANDDASGITAIIMLSEYFSRMDNERTLIFVAFTAEESGGHGSSYFSKQINADKIIAMFNIEMIGTESLWGINSAYITGYEKSDLGKILQTNLVDYNFYLNPDPYPSQNLFTRSDNFKLAILGVPAHTISTSKMEMFPNNEPNYHKQSDEISTLNIINMREIIRAIAVSSKSIVSGKDTPTRIVK